MFCVRCAMKKTRSQVLDSETGRPAPSHEKGVRVELPIRSVREIAQQSEAGSHDQLAVTALRRFAQAIRLAASDEEHLVCVADDIVVTDVPDEQAAVGQ